MTERLRVGVAGVHGHGRGHVDAVLGAADLELVAVADPPGGGGGPPPPRACTPAAAVVRAV
ncbi:hypothetical protein ACLBXX_08270, partial [Microbacterium sp. C23T]